MLSAAAEANQKADKRSASFVLLALLGAQIATAQPAPPHSARKQVHFVALLAWEQEPKMGNLFLLGGDR